MCPAEMYKLNSSFHGKGCIVGQPLWSNKINNSRIVQRTVAIFNNGWWVQVSIGPKLGYLYDLFGEYGHCPQAIYPVLQCTTTIEAKKPNTVQVSFLSLYKKCCHLVIGGRDRALIATLVSISCWLMEIRRHRQVAGCLVFIEFCAVLR